MTEHRSPGARCRAAIFFAALLAFAGPVGAASLQVAPTSLTLQAKQSADGLWLSNSGDTPVQVQLRVFRWTQKDGEEQLELTRDLVISPPMQTLPPGERQLVRLVRTKPIAPTSEMSYRVIVDELPAPNKEQQGLQFVLRYSVPVFIVPETQTPIAPSLRTSLVAAEDGQMAIEIENSGSEHAQIADLVYTDASNKQETIIPGLVGYVLPGQRMRWPLKSPASRFADGVFKARINSGPVEQSLPLVSVAH
ncbi:MAG TPA: molecular chaperone [Pseudoxanthomonas sp.]|nr:molecular chaperone [Pseudoxanthomonas sp.]